MLLSPPRSPQKNEPPMRGSLTLPEFVPKTAGIRFGAMILEIKTGCKRNKGSMRIKHTRKSPLSVIQQKNEPPMRGSLTLPEFVPKTKGSRFGAMILEIKTGRKRNGGLKRIKHTRKSPLSRSNSFLAQKHSPNQNLRKSSAPLCPPNPRFVLIATFTSALRATFGT